MDNSNIMSNHVYSSLYNDNIEVIDVSNEEITGTNTDTDIIDINMIDDDMCYKIWKDFKEQYRPFATSLIKLTDTSTHMYFSNFHNRMLVLKYINKRLKGIQIVKIKPIGMSYFFVVIKRIFEDTINSKIDNLQQQVITLKKIINDLEIKFLKLYYAPGMPGYIEASKEFNETVSKMNESTNEHDTNESTDEQMT